MLVLTNYNISSELLQQAQQEIPNIDSRLSLNQPTGRFFNDPWEIRPEFKGTVWEQILDSLDEDKGEARLIKLMQGTCYPSHADIDDRWHLAIQGNHSYLIDLETNTMHLTDKLGSWYMMDAGIRHSAANFGSCDRIQLVVRKLLPLPKIINPQRVSIKLKTVVDDRRFIFDDIISPWLNRAYKLGIVENFKGEDLEATLIIEAGAIDELINISSEYFTISITSQQ
jgi:hypothetical protein